MAISLPSDLQIPDLFYCHNSEFRSFWDAVRADRAAFGRRCLTTLHLTACHFTDALAGGCRISESQGAGGVGAHALSRWEGSMASHSSRVAAPRRRQGLGGKGLDRCDAAGARVGAAAGARAVLRAVL